MNTIPRRMASRKIVGIIIGLITIGAIAVFGITLRNAVFGAPEVEMPIPPKVAITQAAHTNGLMPTRLLIPSLNIDANVQYVGLKTDGSMGTPHGFTDVAWYKYGPEPGQIGSAVIAGHLDNGLSLAGVFKHLSDIQIGSDVNVIDKDGNKLTFQVVDKQSYDYQNAPTSKVFNQTDAARLNLITCDGTWVKGAKTYNQRLVVYTVLK